MRRRWVRLNSWLDNRTGIQSAVRQFLYEQIPASSGWHQVFGSVAVFLFLTQAFTGALLAFNYAPTPGDAYNSLRYILTELTGGRLMRGLHHWGASMMIVVVVLHMVQVFLWGAYKKPREATWMVGVVLLLVTLAYGLTGYLLPWDNRAYWGTVVTTQIAAQAPVFVAPVGRRGRGRRRHLRALLWTARAAAAARDHPVDRGPCLPRAQARRGARAGRRPAAENEVLSGAGFSRHPGHLHRFRRAFRDGLGRPGA